MITSFFENTLVYDIQISKRQYDLFPHLDNFKDELFDADIIDQRDNRQLLHEGTIEGFQDVVSLWMSDGNICAWKSGR